MNRHRRGGQHPLGLARDDRQGAERPAFVLTSHLVSDRLVGTALPGEHRMQRLDGLLRARQLSCADELSEELATEEPVVLEALVRALENRDAGIGVRAESTAG